MEGARGKEEVINIKFQQATSITKIKTNVTKDVRPTMISTRNKTYCSAYA